MKEIKRDLYLKKLIDRKENDLIKVNNHFSLIDYP